MGPEGIILVNSPITTFQQSLTHSALMTHEDFRFRYLMTKKVAKIDLHSNNGQGPRPIHWASR